MTPDWQHHRKSDYNVKNLVSAFKTKAVKMTCYLLTYCNKTQVKAVWLFSTCRLFCKQNWFHEFWEVPRNTGRARGGLTVLPCAKVSTTQLRTVEYCSIWEERAEYQNIIKVQNRIVILKSKWKPSEKRMTYFLLRSIMNNGRDICVQAFCLLHVLSLCL